MRRTRSVAPPWQAWVVVVSAFALGVFQHLRSPMGVFLFTPRDWCTGRTHAFGLGYGAVLLGAAIAATGVLLGSLLGRPFAGSRAWRDRLTSMSGTAFRCLVLFAIAAILTPALEGLMPLKTDPRCDVLPRVST